VEDSIDIRESLGLILRMWGHHVELAQDGAQGLERARETRPDIALIDIGLPELNGYEVARAIRGDGDPWARSVTLVALTGYGRDADRRRALDAGFDLHLVKPIDPEVLARILDAPSHPRVEIPHAAGRGRAPDPNGIGSSDALRP
jgi:CheY-like chemotaxis protein